MSDFHRRSASARADKDSHPLLISNLMEVILINKKKTTPKKTARKKTLSKKLTPKQAVFVGAYCENGFNATQAVIAAGYSPKTAQQAGSRLLLNVVVQQAISAHMAEIKERALITTEDIVKGLISEAQYFGDDASHSARVSAYKTLTDYTGGFDNNRTKTESTIKVQQANDSEW